MVCPQRGDHRFVFCGEIKNKRFESEILTAKTDSAPPKYRQRAGFSFRFFRNGENSVKTAPIKRRFSENAVRNAKKLTIIIRSSIIGMQFAG